MWQPSLISRADSSRAVALGREQHWDQSGDLLNTPGRAPPRASDPVFQRWRPGVCMYSRFLGGATGVWGTTGVEWWLRGHRLETTNANYSPKKGRTFRVFRKAKEVFFHRGRLNMCKLEGKRWQEDMAFKAKAGYDCSWTSTEADQKCMFFVYVCV